MKSMERMVIDASVGAKWIFEEESSAEALSLIEQAWNGQLKLLVPELFYVEVANICWQRMQRKMSSYDYVSKMIDELARLPLEQYSDSELFDVAFDNATQFKISAYDAIYVSLAEIYVVPLVTADDMLIKTCKGRFDFILPLDEVKTVRI